MKAIRIHEDGGPEVLRYEDALDPKPEPGEVLIRLRAASLNHLDIWVRQGLPSVPKPRPRRVRERPDSGGVRVVAKERLAGRLNAGRRGGSLPAAGGRRI